MTSNAAAEEIQQIIKQERETKADKNEFKSETTESEKTGSDIIYEDDYSGAIRFLESPIKESFLADIKEQLRIEFEKSFRNLKEYKLLEKEMKQEKESSLIESDESPEKMNVEEVSNNLKGAVLDRLSTLFLPEFLNRLDDIIIFQPLSPEEIRKICDIMVKELVERVKTKEIFLTVDDNVKAKLSREGYNPLFGARPLRRLITKYIEDLISENMLKIPVTKRGREIKVILNENDKVVIKKEKITT
jgi:ATP-dependent Clp protease ATP-binding subunit ClpA